MKNKPSSDNQTQYLSLGMCLGVAIGTALGVALDKLSVCLPIGLSIGLCIGTFLGCKKPQQNRREFLGGQYRHEYIG